MNATEKIADQIHARECRAGCVGPTTEHIRAAEAVVAAIRAMSPTEQAELIPDGWVEVRSHRRTIWDEQATAVRDVAACDERVVGPWVVTP